MNAERWTEFSRRYALRPFRERLVLILAALFGLVFVWNDYLQESLVQQAASDPKRLNRFTQDNVKLAEQHAELTFRAKADPNTLLRASIERLQVQNQRLDEDIRNSSGRLVDPTRMVSVLSRVLSKQNDVQLMAMNNLPSEKLVVRSTALARGSALQIYKHGLSFEVKGRYLAIIEYLEALEASDAGFYWEGARFAVEEYPYGTLSVKVFTLSTRAELLDV